MTFLASFLAGLFGMEAVAWASHKWLMHGPLWFLHASHHRDRRGRWEANDLFGIFFSAISIALIWRGLHHPAVLGLGIGMAAYGVSYLFIHDALAHARFGRMGFPRFAYLRRLVRAHRLHHSRDAFDGTRNFGFLWAPSPSRARSEGSER